MNELCAEETAARRSVGGRHLSCITSEKQPDSQEEKKHTMPGIRESQNKDWRSSKAKSQIIYLVLFRCDSTQPQPDPDLARAQPVVRSNSIG